MGERGRGPKLEGMRKCDSCGKMFLWHTEYIYKLPANAQHGTLCFCCYTCYRKAQVDYAPGGCKYKYLKDKRHKKKSE